MYPVQNQVLATFLTPLLLLFINHSSSPSLFRPHCDSLPSNPKEPLSYIKKPIIRYIQIQNTSFRMQASSSIVPKFVEKTFIILSNQQNQHIVSWMPSGKSFAILDHEAFSLQVLPNTFRHNNLNSFIRQLNMYGFHKCRKDPARLIFSHPFFVEGREDLLLQVKRKIHEKRGKEDGKSSTDRLGKREIYLPEMSDSHSNMPQAMVPNHIEHDCREEETPARKERVTDLETECKTLPSAINFSSYLHFGQGQPLPSLISSTLLMEGRPFFPQKEAPSLKCIGSENCLWGSEEPQW